MYAPLSDLDAVDDRIIETLRVVTGATDIVVRQSWRTLPDPTADDVIDHQVLSDGDLVIEWIKRKGRFGLDLELYGPALPTNISELAFMRLVTHALGRSLLISDCSAFGFSWLKVDPDGAVSEVVSDVSDIDNFDLLSDDPSKPDYAPDILLYAPDDPLPTKPPGAPADMPSHVAGTCELMKPGQLCRQNWGACPKRR